jgi:predicted ribosome quality control (RQC) complex YloA/Tae2 family protein
MSLNWKEIDLILDELDLAGAQIQSAAQSAFDIIGLRVHKMGITRQLLIALSPGACRFHETFKPFPKSDKPLRFAQFLNSRVVNGWIEEAAQLGDNRIIRLLIKRGENRFRLYIRLWSNAANCIVTDEQGVVLDAMRRLPKKGEISGGQYAPEETAHNAGGSRREYDIRELPGDGSFNAKIDAFYAEQGGALSLEALREQARRNCEGSMGRLQAALQRLRAKETEFSAADRLREYGDIILANIAAIKPGDTWLEADNFYANSDTGAGVAAGVIRIKLDPLKSASAQAE